MWVGDKAGDRAQDVGAVLSQRQRRIGRVGRRPVHLPGFNI